MYIKKHSDIKNSVKDFNRKDFNMEVLYDEKYITTKIKPYEYEIKTDFCNDVLPP